MRQVPALLLGFVLLAAPVRSAVNNPPSEVEIAAQLRAIQKQKDELQKKEQQLKDELTAAKSRPFGGIKAEVRGIMHQDSSGYYILIRMDHGQELRVWLHAEDIKMDSHFKELDGKEVDATGQLLQRIDVDDPAKPQLPEVPSPVRRTKVPERAMYFRSVVVRDAHQVAPPVMPPSTLFTPPSVIPPTSVPANPK